LLQVATVDGYAAHLVDTWEDTKDGHLAYCELVLWYEGDNLTTETAEDVRSKLDKLFLNTRISASEYVNSFQLLTKQLNDLGESYTESKTVQIFLSQITDPDFENTKEFCVENKLKVSECIERIRAKERRLSRDHVTSKTKTLSIRRAEVLTGEGPIDINKYKNAKGYFSVPRDTWHTLDGDSQERIKKHNGDLRKARKNGNPNDSADVGERTMTTRRTPTSDGKEDPNSSPHKKLRTVQFRTADEDDDQNILEKPHDNHDADTSNVIKQRRSDILTFQVQDDKK